MVKGRDGPMVVGQLRPRRYPKVGKGSQDNLITPLGTRGRTAAEFFNFPIGLETHDAR